MEPCGGGAATGLSLVLQIQEIIVKNRVVGQLGVKGCGHHPAELNENRIGTVFCVHQNTVSRG